MNIIIKDEHLQTVIGFGKSGLPLGQRNDLDELAIMAHKSGDPTLLNLFERLPSLAALQKAKTDRELKALAPAIEEKPTEQEIIDAAVPPEFNQGTKVEELNKKAPSPGTNTK